MTRLGVVTGLGFEAAIARKAGLDARAAGSERGAAMRVAHELAGAGLLVSFGLAGGLDPGLRSGAIVIGSEVIGAEGPWQAAPTGLTALAAALPEAVLGALYGAHRPLATRDDKALTFRATGAVAVDMESAGVAIVARAAALPFLALRVVLDPAELDLPRAALAGFGRGGGFAVGAVLAGLARHPGELPALILLARAMLASRQTLQRAADGLAAAGTALGLD